MMRVNPIAYGLVLTVPADPVAQDRSVREWARGAGLEDRPTVIHVSDGLAAFTVGTRLSSVNGGSPEFLAWHGAPALVGPFDELEEALSLRSTSRPMATAAS
jgi:hypothetical protein